MRCREDDESVVEADHFYPEHVFHVALFMDFNVKIAYIFIVLDNFIKVLNHLKFPHNDTVILIIALTDVVKHIFRISVAKFTQNINSVLF